MEPGMVQKGEAKKGGRVRGVPNKTTALLKEAILRAGEKAGGKDGLIGYLTIHAKANPGPFMALLGKVLPMQVAGDADNPLKMIHKIERIIVSPTD